LCEKDCDEARPAYVTDRLGQPAVPDHPLDVQAFHSESAVASNPIMANFMSVYAAKIGNPRADLGHTAPGFLSIGAAFFLARQRIFVPKRLG
jgi:hypothetical protein